MVKHLSLAAEFPRASEADWRKLVDGVLKGADFSKKLVGQTRDGIAIMPLEPRRAHATPIAGARGAAPWKTVARLDHPDAHEANMLAHEELKDGADAIALVFGGAASARGFGLADNSPHTLDAALKGIHLDLISTRLEVAPFTGRATAEAFASYCAKNRLPGANVKVDFGLAPIAAMAATGRAPMPFALMISDLSSLIKDLQAKGFSGPFLRADSRPFADAGASEAQELAATLAQVVAYIRAIGAKGVKPQEAVGLISVTLLADDDQFLSLAKLRAWRLLQARVEEALGIAHTPVSIHVETGWRMLTKYDSYTNVLRNTIAAFAAGVGGADSLAVLPLTAVLGLADGAARRLARNTSLILLEESNLHRVIDPSAGAGGIEALTDAIAAKAWALFQQIEAQKHDGEVGIVAALANGYIGEALRDTRDARAKDLATRKQPMTGVSEFPNVAETLPSVLKPAPAAKPGDGLPVVRFAEGYEALRMRAEKAKAPKVFLANLGRIPDFNARATFAKNAFEAGGIVAVGNDGFAEGEGTGTNLVAMTDAFKASGAPLACICSSDALYAEEAADAATALIASGAKAVYLAGKPAELEATLMAAGVSGFVSVGTNMLAFLDGALKICEA